MREVITFTTTTTTDVAVKVRVALAIPLVTSYWQRQLLSTATGTVYSPAFSGCFISAPIIAS